MDTKHEIFTSVTQAAAIKKIPIRQLRLAKKKGAPGFIHHRLDWTLFEPWYVAHHNELVAEAEDTLIEWKTRLTKANALIAETNLEELKEKYLLKEDVESRFRAIAQAQRAILRTRLTQELPQKLLGLTVPEISVVMESTLNDICSLMNTFEVK